MLLVFLSHQWKSFWRSRNAGKSFALQMVIGFFAVYLMAVAIFSGIYLKENIVKHFPGRDPSGVFCGFILYYFCVDLLARFNMQELPTLTVQPYLVLRIRRRQLIRFLNIRSLLSFFNILPLILSVPFAIVQIGPEYGPAAMTAFMVTIFSLAVFNHFVMMFIKRKTIVNSWWIAGFFLAVALFAGADYFKIFSLSRGSEFLFGAILVHPVLALIAVGMATAACVANYRFMYKSLYLDEIARKAKSKGGSDYAFLNRFGDIGELVALDLKLMLRNKRPRTVLAMSGIFLFYGFILYKPQLLNDRMIGFLLFGAVFMTGIFIVNYGQFLFAWQSSHFDGLMAGRLSMRTYIKSKFVLFMSVSTIQLLLSCFYGFMSWKLIPIQIAAYFFNIGLHSVFAVYFATFGYKGIDISRKAAFNYQGLGAAQWIYTLAIFLIPLILYLPVGLIFGPWAGIASLGVIGLISLLLQDWWIGVLTREFIKRKYLILQGFREK